MASVTNRVKAVQQPKGGYLPIKCFKKEVFEDGEVLNETENIHASLVGTAVDYLTRFLLGASVDKAFHISSLGAANVLMTDKANLLKSMVTGLDDVSIVSACKLAGFDVCYRSSKFSYKPIEDITPDAATIENIRTMVNRSVSFFEKNGPVVCSEPTFEGGYTDTVHTGDGDFLTNDTLWDFKVTKTVPTTKHSLQLLMYYIMGLHSIHEQFKNLTYLGFFNPRLNISYICSIHSIPQEIITDIEKNVICYGTYSQNQKTNGLSQNNANSDGVFFTVSEICSMTGLNKSVVYADIHSNNLIANKKGNKYLIAKQDYFEYLEYLERKKAMQIVLATTSAIISILILLFVIIKTIFG